MRSQIREALERISSNWIDDYRGDADKALTLLDQLPEIEGLGEAIRKDSVGLLNIPYGKDSEAIIKAAQAYHKLMGGDDES